eukprot:CAMPEP_0173426976 /NCGR_PEP_ID=MMETSP1357-20121228/6290_1 /TAXON_ID=77926 /ORGANISM="Hemiselmis rufescens, Strain PCC563" /LENGTH=116 /DNA_ID=CAMNT_0014390719 /DNA_START=397 /DNA_END=744 /DNA_ORIENTATION=-
MIEKYPGLFIFSNNYAEPPRRPAAGRAPARLLHLPRRHDQRGGPPRGVPDAGGGDVARGGGQGLRLEALRRHRRPRQAGRVPEGHRRGAEVAVVPALDRGGGGGGPVSLSLETLNP